MASPQLENGYTRIANEILEALARIRLTSREWRVVVGLLRATYGHQKKSDTISLSQWESITGMPRQHVGGAIGRLETRGIIIVTRGGAINSYEFQKNHDMWLDSTAIGTSTDSGTSTEIGTKTSTEIGTKTSTEIGTHKRKKEKKDIHDAGKTKNYDIVNDSQQMFGALADVCGIDWKVVSEQMRSRLNVSGKKLRDAGYTAAQVTAFWYWWKHNDWRGKQGQRPTPEQVRDSIAQAKQQEVVF